MSSLSRPSTIPIHKGAILWNLWGLAVGSGSMKRAHDVVDFFLEYFKHGWVNSKADMQVMAYKPPTFGNMAATPIQFDFSVYNQIAPSFPPNESFLYENAENEATYRRKDRLMDCRKRRLTSMIFTGCSPAKRNRNENLQSAPYITKSVMSYDAPQCSTSCPPMYTAMSSADTGCVKTVSEVVPSPFLQSSTQKEVSDNLPCASTIPNVLMQNWQPFSAETESNDVEMCNSEMQDLNIITKSEDPVQLDINIQGYLPENITIMTADSELVVSGKKQEIVDSNLVQHKFAQTYSLPSHFDAESITPDFADDGRLTLLCPQLENYTGLVDGQIKLQTIDNDKTVIKKSSEVPTLPSRSIFQ